MNNTLQVPRIRLEVDEDIEFIIREIVRNNQFVNGPQINIFKEHVLKMLDSKHCALVASGFAGLFLTLKALKLANKRILVPSLSTCFSIVNAVIAVGGTPIFCPLDKENLSLDLNAAKRIKTDVGFDAIIVVSHFGIPADIAKFKTLNVPVIEDAAQALLTRTAIRSEADATIFSLYPTKYLNAIDGGIILANDTLIAEINDISYYDNQLVFDGKERFNFRFLNFHAAVGLASIKHLEAKKKKLTYLKEKYHHLLSKAGIEYFEVQFQKNVFPLKLLIRLDDEQKDNFMQSAANLKVEISKELTLLDTTSKDSSHQILIDNIISLPFFDALNEGELGRIIQMIEEYVKLQKSNI